MARCPARRDDMVAQHRNDIRDAAKTGSNLIPVIPQVTLLRIGYLFQAPVLRPLTVPCRV
jgi:hypothetical protein